MRIRSRLDGTVLNAQLQPAAEDVNYGNLVLMVETADGRVALNMVEAQDDYEIVEAGIDEQAQLEQAGYFLTQADREAWPSLG